MVVAMMMVMIKTILILMVLVMTMVMIHTILMVMAMLVVCIDEVGGAGFGLWVTRV